MTFCKYLGVAILCLATAVSGLSAATGDIETAFPAPDRCPTGLTFDGKNLWLADRKSDSLYQIDPDNGGVIKTIDAPGYHVAGLTFDSRYLWVLDLEENLVFQMDTETGVNIKTIAVPCDNPRGLAWDGEYLWVADYRADRLYQISTEDGTTIRDFASPHGNPAGLSYDGTYLWVSDRIKDMIYMVDPATGRVILAFDAPGKYARGLAWDGEYLWNTDYQTDSLYKIKITDTTLYSRKEPRSQELEFSNQFRNYGPGVVTEVDIYLALPRDLPNQVLLDTLSFSPPPTDFVTDQWDQKMAHYRYENVAPGDIVTVAMTARAELYQTRFFIFPDRVGNLDNIPADINKMYLVDGSKYWIDDPTIANAVATVIGDETNCYRIARRLFDYLIDQMEYELSGGWNVAPTVLARGNGSCSEYSFVYIALCRAAGLPARYAGSVAVRGDDASTDQVFHRWVEVYLPNYGWIPVDPSGGDQSRPADQARYFGFLDNRFLITTIGGGGSTFMEWSYNSNEIWQSRGKCKIHSEHIGEWSPLPDIDISDD